MAQKRTRNHAVTLRLTASELEHFDAQFRKSGMKSRSDFILQSLNNSPIVYQAELEETAKETLKELQKQGNNLNQIARKLNEGSAFDEGFKKILNECYKAYGTIVRLWEK